MATALTGGLVVIIVLCGLNIAAIANLNPFPRLSVRQLRAVQLASLAIGLGALGITVAINS